MTEFLDRAPDGWFILDVMRKGDPARPFRRGRPRNEWVALLINVDPDAWCAGEMPRSEAVQSCWLDLGRHRSRDDAWDCADQRIATRH